ncbi:MAG TPA: Bax inhibitor-1 family protein [Solirubrobacteraceae bacterium]|nr:Bax inhibitor-1 family protein [Solirubrobacteraceae bacterium]
MSSSPSYGSERKLLGSAESVGSAGVFGQVMGLVAVTVGFFTLGAYLGRNFTGAAAIVCFILGFISIIGLNFARRSEGLAITMLFAAGLFLGLGLGGGLKHYAEVQPNVIWQAAGATALFVAGLGTTGYAIRRDLSGGYRFLFVALLALIVFGFVSLLVSMPHADVIYAVAGLVIFGGYTVLDFNRLRRTGQDEVVPIAAGIFLDVLNVFLFFLQLLGGGRE